MSSTALIEEHGNADQSRRYYPFGAQADTAIGSLSAYQFAGKENDSTGLYYFGARYFRSVAEIRPLTDDPELGWFLQVDPMADKYPSLTPYQYAFNNPLRFMDPNGMEVRSTDSTKLAQTANEINKLHNNETNITVEKRTELKVSLIGTIKNLLQGVNVIAYKPNTYYALSTENSSFNWGKSKITSALFDVINSKEIIFNVTYTTTHPRSGSEDLGGGLLNPKPGGGTVYLDPSGNISGNESPGIVAMHELIGHGHPVTSTMQNQREKPWGYPAKPGNAVLINTHYGSNRLDPGHAGYHTIIGWSETGLYGR